MNYNELNEYIKHYVEKDQTKSAIMLTGGWGTGKSYYIRNVLEPFLKENGKHGKDKCTHSCAIVSLYGLENTSEISKRIYFELRSVGRSKKSELFSTGKTAAKIIAKTVLNGMTNMIGFDIGNISERDLQKVYSSINLSNVLVIFEDLERSNIDIIDVLGYVNSMVEQDGAKVLLVANEEEMLTYNSQSDNEGKHTIPDEKTAIYLKSKEKTISDTINFEGDKEIAVENIISSFNNKTLNKIKSICEIKDILNLMRSLKNYNMRLFIFACQKAVDIFEKIDNVNYLGDHIIKSIFFGTIYISLKIKDGIIPEIPFENSLYKTSVLTNYPVYRFCYNFIRWQEFNMEDVKATISAHEKQKIFEKDKFEDDNDLKTVLYYYLYSENEIKSAFENIKRRLIKNIGIPLYSYDKLAYALIKIKTVLEIDYSSCQEYMIENIEKERNETAPDYFDWSLSNYSFENADEEDQFIKFSKCIIRALNSASHSDETHEFSYALSDIESLRDFVIENKEQVLLQHKFLSKFDLSKLVEMILKCKPSDLDIFRGILQTVYEDAIRNDFLAADITFMKSLKDKLEKSTPPNKFPLKNLDKILLLQIKFLVKDLTRFIEQLS